MKPIIDISHHQDPAKIDYDKLVANTSGVILRAAYGAQVDRHFDTHYYQIAVKRKHPVGNYHYITQYHSVQSQVDRLKIATEGKAFQLKYWTDVERENGAEPLQQQQVINYINAVEAQIHYIEGIYTSKVQWAAIMNGVYFADKKMWAALYGTNIYNWLPQGWSDYWLWQYTSEGNIDGYNGPLDVNRFRFGDKEFLEWIGEVEPEPEPEPEPVIPEIGFRARVCIWATPYVFVREEPAMTGKVVGTNFPGDVVDVLATKGDWYQLSNGYSMSRYYERISDPEPSYKAKVYAWATPYVFVRRKPDLTGAVVVRNYPGDVVEVKGTNGDWLQLANGYSMAKYYERINEPVEPVEPEPPNQEVLAQRDPRWKNVKLGYSPTITIGQQGCLITSLTMVLNQYGYEETPATVNTKLQAKGGFPAGTPLLYWKVPPVVWDIDYSVWREPWFGVTNLAEIDDWLAKGAWALVHVDLDIETSAIEQHWVVLTEKVGDDYKCRDPWQGDEILFSSRFGQPSQGIFRVCIYSKHD
ncbi:MAG: hypothetical protein KBA03_00705 [Anaerolineaceae bacterium]|nr:hypothetical protein [Anaerolineaceae bacterium]